MIHFKLVIFKQNDNIKKIIKNRNRYLNNIFHITIKKKIIKKAHDRNKLKRQIRYIFYSHKLKDIVSKFYIKNKTFIIILEKIDININDLEYSSIETNVLNSFLSKYERQ